MKLAEKINNLLFESLYAPKLDKLKAIKKVDSDKGLKKGDMLRVIYFDKENKQDLNGYYEFDGKDFQFKGANFSPSDYPKKLNSKQFFVDFANDKIELVK
jgi:hypothetical protein